LSAKVEVAGYGAEHWQCTKLKQHPNRTSYHAEKLTSSMCKLRECSEVWRHGSRSRCRTIPRGSGEEHVHNQGLTEGEHIQKWQKHPHCPAWAAVSSPSAASAAGCCSVVPQQRVWQLYPRSAAEGSRCRLRSQPGTGQAKTGRKRQSPWSCLPLLRRQWLAGRLKPSRAMTRGTAE
jgi:hypothetical protein